MLIEAGLLGNKHVPDAYLRSSPEQRAALLAGLVDTDGCAEQNAVTFTSTKRCLAHAVHELAVSLGRRAYMNEGRAALYGKDCGPYWLVRIAAPPSAVFRLRRKAHAPDRGMTMDRRVHLLVGIDRVPDQAVKCVVVDSPSRLFLAGRDAIATHNSAGAEMAAVMLGHRRLRRYALYVSGSQQKADDHVESIAGLLESDEMTQIDPDLCERRVGKYGSSKGWRHNRLTTKAGYTIDAVGLDSDVRGARLDDARPDVIIFDDVDSSTDTPAIIGRKLTRITRDLIPAGAENVVILFVQNVIHPQSIAARLAGVEGAPDPGFLATRIVSGPIPAVEGLTFDERMDDEVGRLRTFITGGRATWDGFGLARCQRMIDDEGIVSFLAECQHERGTLKGGMFDHIDFAARRASRAELPALTEAGCWRGPCSVWCDPAVSSTDRSDSCAVTVGGVAPDRYWCLFAWEHIASPEEAMRVAVEAGMRWGAQVCGFETDQGGDTWEVVYRKVVADQLADPDSYVATRLAEGVAVPRYDWAKAGGTEGNLSKRGRVQQLVARYDVDEFRHLDDAAAVLEAGLSRFPKFKPFDVVDSWWHNWRWMAQHSRREGGGGYRTRSPSRSTGPVPDVRP